MRAVINGTSEQPLKDARLFGLDLHTVIVSMVMAHSCWAAFGLGGLLSQHAVAPVTNRVEGI